MGLEQVLDYRVTFSVPEKEGHTYAQFEALTGYMPWEFQQFLRWSPEQKKLVPLDKQSGEQYYEQLDKMIVSSSANFERRIYATEQEAFAWLASVGFTTDSTQLQHAG